MRQITFSFNIKKGSITLTIDNDTTINLSAPVSHTNMMLEAFAEAFADTLSEEGRVIIKAVTTSARKANGAE